jgi:hypothetical protein
VTLNTKALKTLINERRKDEIKLKIKQFYYIKNDIRRKRNFSNRFKISNKNIQKLNTQLFKIHILIFLTIPL